MNQYKTAFSEIASLPHPFSVNGGRYTQPPLDNMRRLNRFLGCPFEKLKIIHVGGTNGKGSCVNMLASVLISLGKKIGVYQSPHIFDCRERITINGQKIPVADFCRIWQKQKEYVKNHMTTYSEVLVSMAMRYFVENKVDIAIVEVGIGGMNDPTNICKHPIFSVITSIGFAHTQLLGCSLKEITHQKAGIIKQFAPVILGNVPAGVIPQIEEVAKVKRARVIIAANYWKALSRANQIKHDKWFDIQGDFQQHNVKTVVTLLSLLAERRQFHCLPMPSSLVRNALRKTRERMSFRGRWEVVKHTPLVVFDVCSNVFAWHQIILNLRRLKFKGLFDKLFIIMAFSELSTFDTIKLRKELACEAYYIVPYTCATLDAESILANLKVSGVSVPSLTSAIEKGLSMASKRDMIFIGGSHYLASQVLSFFK